MEFLRYPRLLPTLFNGCGSGPPPPLTAASAWTWIGHPVSGLRIPTKPPCSGLVSLRLHAFKRLTLPAPATRRTVLQKVRGPPPGGVPQFVDAGFQVLFHSPPGVLFTFPSQYYCTIGHWVVLSLGGWSPRLPAGFPVSRGTLDPACCTKAFAYGAFTPSGRLSQSRSAGLMQCFFAVRNPGTHARRFGLAPFRSPLLGGSSFLSFPPGT